MADLNSATGGLPGPAPEKKSVAKPAKVYELDGRDRGLLLPALALGVLCVHLFLSLLHGWPGLGVTALTALWYAALFWYRGTDGLWKGANRWLFPAVCLLGLTFSLYSKFWFRFWNTWALAGLMGVQLFELCGGTRFTWERPRMLLERLHLTLRGLFGRLGAPVGAISSLGKGERQKKLLYMLLGLAAALPALLLAMSLLTSADALFQHVAGGVADFLEEHVSSWVIRLVLGAAAGLFLYGLLYFLRRPEPVKEKKDWALPILDPAAPVTLLVVMDALYLFFLAIQFAALFGGERYLAAAGVSYADYARSGFFQLVFVAVLNLSLVLLALQFCKRAGQGWLWTRILSTALVGMSAVLLVSAGWRMTLYVGEYGLSFKRLLTYWGMALLAVLFAAALLKIWRTEFAFFKVFFLSCVAGWLVLNFMNPDYLVARYNVTGYQNGSLAAIDVSYLAWSSWEALPILEELPEDLQVYSGRSNYTLGDMLAERRAAAARACAHWETWSLAAQRAAGGS